MIVVGNGRGTFVVRCDRDGWGGVGTEVVEEVRDRDIGESALHRQILTMVRLRIVEIVVELELFEFFGMIAREKRGNLGLLDIASLQECR